LGIVRYLALLVFVAIAPASSFSQHRSEVRDQARAQRHSTRVSGATLNQSSHDSRYCTACDRDQNGRIRRSPAARRAFQASHPCPATGSTSGACPGYVVDHTIPLKRGGPDDPSNMQWQTTAEAKAKDRIE
jgi:hypothetical protein